MNRVVVGRYTFETDLPVKLGDRVLLPTPSWLVDVKGPTWEGEITALTSDYTGECSRILRIITEPPQDNPSKLKVVKPEHQLFFLSRQKVHFVKEIHENPNGWDSHVFYCDGSAKTGSSFGGGFLSPETNWCKVCRAEFEKQRKS